MHLIMWCPRKSKLCLTRNTLISRNWPTSFDTIKSPRWIISCTFEENRSLLSKPGHLETPRNPSRRLMTEIPMSERTYSSWVNSNFAPTWNQNSMCVRVYKHICIYVWRPEPFNEPIFQFWGIWHGSKCAIAKAHVQGRLNRPSPIIHILFSTCSKVECICKVINFFNI